MKIETEEQVTGEVARQMRRGLGLSQEKFWGVIGVNRDTGHGYERGRKNGLPRTVRKLLFMHYVLGLPVGGSAEELRQVAQLASSTRLTLESMQEATRLVDEASAQLAQATEIVNGGA